MKQHKNLYPFPVTVPQITATRHPNSPIITFKTHPSLGDNINGPSLIKVPNWVEKPLGRYYLYFGHHKGQFIRLAYADAVEGPWHIYVPGLIPLEQVPVFHHHLTSPDVHIDPDEDQFGVREHASIRHSAMLLEGDTLYLFFSRKEDAPERIQCVHIALTDDWETWQISKAIDVLRPETPFEGIQYELKPSKLGYATGVQELRDPAIYREGNNIWMIYSHAGEEGLALASLDVKGVNA